jgi:hypothetical protein
VRLAARADAAFRLRHSGDDSWAQRLADYSQARAAMNKVREQTRTIENEINACAKPGGSLATFH